jgi:hypothetical protein
MFKADTVGTDHTQRWMRVAGSVLRLVMESRTFIAPGQWTRDV